MSNIDTLKNQINFIVEVDKLKGILRKTSPIGMQRLENSAEHSWQVVLSAILFAEHANENIDLLKVVKMLVIHDVVEIDVGDTFHYAKDNNNDLYAQELAAAQRIFGLLAAPQRDELLALWQEFEARQTPEAQYAAAVDRIMAFFMNMHNQGGTWAKYNIPVELVLEKNAHIQNGSKNLWKIAQRILEDAYSQGYIRKKRVS
jgi:putative hydrolase of HD superfamily